MFPVCLKENEGECRRVKKFSVIYALAWVTLVLVVLDKRT